MLWSSLLNSAASTEEGKKGAASGFKGLLLRRPLAQGRESKRRRQKAGGRRLREAMAAASAPLGVPIGARRGVAGGCHGVISMVVILWQDIC